MRQPTALEANGVRQEGSLTANREAWITVRLVAGVEVEVLIDTGFQGGLVLPESLVQELGLTVIGHQKYEMVGAASGEGTIAWAQVEWLGQVETVEVLTAEDYLIGTDLLADTKLTVDYVLERFTLERLR